MSEQQAPLEYQKWLHELKRREAERAHDNAAAFSLKLNEAAMENANLALRTAVLINGGAAVSILAFVGGLVSQGKVAAGPQLTQIADSLVCFASAVAAAALAMGFSYFTNYCISASWSRRRREWEHPYVVETDHTRLWLRAAITCQI
jgi:hypothetical protein